MSNGAVATLHCPLPSISLPQMGLLLPCTAPCSASLCLKAKHCTAKHDVFAQTCLLSIPTSQVNFTQKAAVLYCQSNIYPKASLMCSFCVRGCSRPYISNSLHIALNADTVSSVGIHCFVSTVNAIVSLIRLA